MDRISKIFSQSKAQNRASLVIFVSAGYPNMQASEQSIELAIANGAEIIELGVPFSDPMADGKVICDASAQALQNGVNLQDVLDLASRIRSKYSEIGLVVFSYMNPLYSYGLEAFASHLAARDIDGVLAVDLSLEERKELSSLCHKHGRHLINLVSPNTPIERMKEIANGASGFIYYISVKGVTGARTNLPDNLQEKLYALKSITTIPVVAGFGISDGAGANCVAQCADGVVVGSAFVKVSTNLEQACKLVKELTDNLKKT